MAKKPRLASASANLRAEMSGTRSLVMNGELVLYGVVDPFAYDEFDSSIRAIDVMASLTELTASENIVVRINSPGGSVVEGLAIYNLLRASGKPIEVQIDAMAASIASIIAMAGDTVIMAESASIMIHDPWGVAIGGSEDMRKNADEIDRLKAILVNIYTQKTGLDASEVEAMMTAETYMSAAEAVERGFATAIDQPMAIAACAPLDRQRLARLLAPTARDQKAPITAAPAAPLQEAQMSQTASGAAGDPVPTPVPTPAPGVILPDEGAIRASAIQAERERTQGIMAQARAARIPSDDAFVQSLLTGNRPLVDARNDIMNEWSRRQEARPDNPPGGERPSGIEVQADAVDRWAEGAERGLLIRTNLARAEDRDRGNEFVGLTLAELARSSLTVRNIKSGGENRMEMIGRAFTVRNSGPGFHSTSDFPSILQNVAYRAVLKGYQEVDETFPLWTGKGTASDFRPISRVDMGLFPSLGKVEEGAEYTYATMGDTGTVVQVATYGRLFAITRQAIINDDLQFFQRVPERMGRAAKRTIGNLVYAVLNGNPTMQDGVALFNAAHGNLATVAGAPSVTSLAAAMAAMQIQTDTSGIGTGGGVMPKYVLTPPALWMPTKVAITSANYPGDPASVANPIRDMFTPIADSRLSGTSWYMAADPNQQDTIEVTYLDGVEEPFLDQKDGWTVDGTEMKVRIDAGVKALHWRGLYRNVGA
ncbi:Clp protease ClpP [Methylobacterium organophilum]|nr:Clp protease ClpP [Methylobacterium organophilum]